MDKSKLASISERLKSGGSQMGRIVSLKMREVKEMLQAPTPESKIVDQATSPTVEAPYWGLNLRICDMINSKELDGTEVVRVVKRKISPEGGDAHTQKLALELLETCSMNCEKVFSEIVSENVLEEMVKVIENPQSGRECSGRAMEMIRAWGESEDLIYLPVFRQTSEYIKQKGMASQVQDGNFPSTQHSLEPQFDKRYISPPSSYPVPEIELNGTSEDEFGSFSVEGKAEFLEITRNSLEVLSSLVNSASESKHDLPKDELTMSMLDKCKESQPVIKTIIETTADESLLFEALSLHDELEKVVSKFSSLEVSESSELSIAQLPEECFEVSVEQSTNIIGSVQVQQQPEFPKSESKATTDSPALLEAEFVCNHN